MTDVGMLVANQHMATIQSTQQIGQLPAYHGTVVWSWPLAMMARGLELQLSRCNSTSVPDFCSDGSVYGNVKKAYNMLWDSIEANSDI